MTRPDPAEVAAALLGTCEDLGTHLDRVHGVDEADLPVEWNQDLDNRVFQCRDCSWWHEIHDDATGDHQCLDCQMEEEDREGVEF